MGHLWAVEELKGSASQKSEHKQRNETHKECEKLLGLKDVCKGDLV